MASAPFNSWSRSVNKSYSWDHSRHSSTPGGPGRKAGAASQTGAGILVPDDPLASWIYGFIYCFACIVSLLPVATHRQRCRLCAFTAGRPLIWTSLNLCLHWLASTSVAFHMEDNKHKAGKLKKNLFSLLGMGRRWNDTFEFTLEQAGQTLPLLLQCCPLLLQGAPETALTEHLLHLWL